MITYCQRLLVYLLNIDTENNITNNTKEYKLIKRQDNIIQDTNLSLSMIIIDNNKVRIREDQMNQ